MEFGGHRPFPRQYRLTKTDEFSSVFGFRRAIRGKLLMLHYGDLNSELQMARLGVVVGKKFLKLAVQRNLVKRVVREQFRLIKPDLPPRDLVIRMVVRLKKANRRAVADDLAQLLGKLKAVRTPEKTEKTPL